MGLSAVAAGLPPSIFAIVMATGIVSLAASGAGLRLIAHVLFWLNVPSYAFLWLLLLYRCAWYPDRLLADLQSHGRAPGFFTTVAATGVLGSQCVLMYEAPGVAVVLWLLALLLWFVLTYTVLPGLIALQNKPSLDLGLNGGWLLAVVATQAICVLGCLVASSLSLEQGQLVLFISLAFWLVGGMLYIWLIALIFYRVLFLPLAPGDLAPPYWINMGAMAISTLAGVLLARQVEHLRLLDTIVPFLAGMTLLYWATATWWIPLLLALGVWRHLQRRIPLSYDHGYWAAVFPLGMYTVCTQELHREFRLPFLALVPEVFFWIALAAWGLTVAGLVLSLVKGTRIPETEPAQEDQANRRLPGDPA